MTYLRQIWVHSRAFRIAMVAASVCALLRLIMHLGYLAVMMSPALLPDWVGAEEPMVPVDLQLYLDGADRIQRRQELYPTWDVIEIYQYSPAFALAFVPFLWLPPAAVTVIHTLLHIAAYGLLYTWWGRIFRRLDLGRASEMLIWTLPVWLVFSAFWSDLGYLNIYIIVALLATLLIDALLEERLGWSLVWLSIILLTKPHWAFAAAVPMLLGRRLFFTKLVTLAVLACTAAVGVTLLAVGPSYGLQQYTSYVQLLANMRQYFPWRGPDAGFMGYNHSIAQIVVYLLGVTPGALHLATGIKALLLVPLAAVSLRQIDRSLHANTHHETPQLGLDWAFALYLGVFIWLDMVWELSLGIAVFTYLVATLHRRGPKTWVWGVFLLYALLDIWRAVSFILSMFGLDIVAPGLYILTDPSIYVPLTMLVILTFYTLLVRRLWAQLVRPCAASGPISHLQL